MINLNKTNSWDYGQDALEAFNTFSGARNIFFWLLAAGLVLTQVVFWVVDQGGIDPVLETAKNQRTGPQCISYCPGPGSMTISGELSVGGKTEIPDELSVGGKTEIPDELSVGGQAEASADRTEDILDHDKQLARADAVDKTLGTILKGANCLLTFFSVVYCLTLLIGMKLALIGRLGGLADAGRAFFLSLIVMVFIVPWQQMIFADVPGVLYDYAKLKIWCTSINGTAGYILYYGRFTGFWLLCVVLLLMAQRHSGRLVKRVRLRIMQRQKQTAPADNIEPIAQGIELEPAAEQDDIG